MTTTTLVKGNHTVTTSHPGEVHQLKALGYKVEAPKAAKAEPKPEPKTTKK